MLVGVLVDPADEHQLARIDEPELHVNLVPIGRAVEDELAWHEAVEREHCLLGFVIAFGQRERPISDGGPNSLIPSLQRRACQCS